MDQFFLSGTLAKRLGVKKERTELPSTGEFLVSLMRSAQIENRPGVDAITHAIHSAIDSACTISGMDPSSGAKWSGSGFLVEGGLIITAAHVLPKGDEIVQVSFDGKTSLRAVAVAKNDEYDVGALRLLDSVSINPVRLASKDKELIPGEQIAVIGSPEGWDNVVTVGRVSAVGRTPGVLPDPSWQDMIFIDAEISEGSSGSMVINIEGEVVGVVMGLIGLKVQEFNQGQRAVIPTARVFEALLPEGGGSPQGGLLDKKRR